MSKKLNYDGCEMTRLKSPLSLRSAAARRRSVVHLEEMLVESISIFVLEKLPKEFKASHNLCSSLDQT